MAAANVTEAAAVGGANATSSDVSWKVSAAVGFVVAGALESSTHGLLLALYAARPAARKYFSTALLGLLCACFIDGLVHASGRAANAASPNGELLSSVSPRFCTAVLCVADAMDVFIMLQYPLLAVERYANVRYPHAAARARSRRLVSAAMAVAAVIAATMSSLPAFVWYSSGGSDQTVVNTDLECGGAMRYNSASVVAYASMLTACLCVAVPVYTRLFAATRGSLQRAGGPVTRRSSQLRRSALLTAGVTALYALTTLPFAAVIQLLPFCKAATNSSLPASVCSAAEPLYEPLSDLSSAGFIAMPLLLVAMSEPIRREAASALRRGRCCRCCAAAAKATVWPSPKATAAPSTTASGRERATASDAPKSQLPHLPSPPPPPPPPPLWLATAHPQPERFYVQRAALRLVTYD